MRFLIAMLILMLICGCSHREPPAEAKKLPPPRKLEKKTALVAKDLDGALEGKVLYDGEPPPLVFLDRINDHEDRKTCLQGDPAEFHKQTWMVNKETKAVANVVVWLEPPTGTFFSLLDKDKSRAGEMVVIDQPHCAFIPHVVAVFPSYFDGARQVKTGQKLQVRNSAPFLHSVQWNPTRENDQFSGPIAKDGGQIEVVLNPQTVCLAIGCGIHNWMHGIVWIFDHPYFAVTREDGSFRIDHLPTGVEVTFKAWHESRLPPFEQRPITLKAGANPVLELKIKN